MRTFLRDNGLTIVLGAAFVLSVLGMLFAGWATQNAELADHGRPSIGLVAYMSGGEFLSALFENWESEFLQMAAYVILTAMLFQRGSAESRDPDAPERAGDEVPRSVHKGRAILSWLYSRSLGIALALLFIASFVLHWTFSLEAANERAEQHGRVVQTLAVHLFDPQLWFESFQNWQSEFLSTAILVVLSIFLRHKGSPESKPVNAAHQETGG